MTRSQVLDGKWSPLLHTILSLPVISSYLVFKLLHALMICYKWITDGNHLTALWLIPSTVCCFFFFFFGYQTFFSWCLCMLQSLCEQDEAPRWRCEPCQQAALGKLHLHVSNTGNDPTKPACCYQAHLEHWMDRVYDLELSTIAMPTDTLHHE